MVGPGDQVLQLVGGRLGQWWNVADAASGSAGTDDDHPGYEEEKAAHADK